MTDRSIPDKRARAHARSLSAMLCAGLLAACGGGDSPDMAANAERQRAEAAALDKAMTMARAATQAKVRGERTQAAAAANVNGN
jgi:hypothetical protein